jgi:UDP-N-acetylglucosamine 2-epimerase (non-hydrolysing)
VESGTVRLVGTEREIIESTTKLLLDNPQEYERMAKAVNPYGDGHASRRIVNALLGETDHFLSLSPHLWYQGQE